MIVRKRTQLDAARHMLGGTHRGLAVTGVLRLDLLLKASKVPRVL